MNNAALVSRLQRLANAVRNVERVSDLKRATCDSLRQRFALDQFEDKKPHVADFLEIVDGCDVRVIERRQNFRFTLESTKSIVIARKLFGHNLDRDFTLQLGVTSAVNLAHPALAEQRSDFI